MNDVGCRPPTAGEAATVLKAANDRSLASLAMFALLRMAAAGCSPSITAAARRSRGVARSGRESRIVSRIDK